MQSQHAFDEEFSNYLICSVDEDDIATRSELDDYLKLPLERVQDPLKWWYNQRRVYPTLSRMARDYLSIPGAISQVSFD
jgi:hAT family dimerisation domain.